MPPEQGTDNHRAPPEQGADNHRARRRQSPHCPASSPLSLLAATDCAPRCCKAGTGADTGVDAAAFIPSTV
eukprot:1698658-Prymnesium_polylepis.1